MLLYRMSTLCSLGLMSVVSSFRGAYWFFFCKQKTAYEMRISDWSSDVCSADLGDAGQPRARKAAAAHRLGQRRVGLHLALDLQLGIALREQLPRLAHLHRRRLVGRADMRVREEGDLRLEAAGDDLVGRQFHHNRKGLVWGKRMAGRVDLGG